MGKKVKSNKEFKQIGEAIKQAWLNGASTKTIDRDALLAELELDGSFKGSGQNTIVYDIITDQDIDDNTRMVWICIPSPDVDKNGDWTAYANSFDTDDELENLGRAALFGCGR